MAFRENRCSVLSDDVNLFLFNKRLLPHSSVFFLWREASSLGN